MIFSSSFIYYVFCNTIDEASMYYFLCFVLASIVTAVFEGNTVQHDNLLGAVLHYGMVVLFVNMFMFDEV